METGAGSKDVENRECLRGRLKKGKTGQGVPKSKDGNTEFGRCRVETGNPKTLDIFLIAPKPHSISPTFP